jgi:hypothetical protein
MTGHVLYEIIIGCKLNIKAFFNANKTLESNKCKFILLKFKVYGTIENFFYVIKIA